MPDLNHVNCIRPHFKIYQPWHISAALDTSCLSSSPSTSLSLVSWQQDIPRLVTIVDDVVTYPSLVQARDESGLRSSELSQPTSREHFRNDNLLGNKGQSHWENQVNCNEQMIDKLFTSFYQADWDQLSCASSKCHLSTYHQPYTIGWGTFFNVLFCWH